MNQRLSLAEEHLLSLIRQGDQDGWAQFLNRYQGRMIAFAKSQTKQVSDAEDLVQETFVGFIRSIDSYRRESNLESWLFRILRRRIIDYYRTRGANREITACCVADESPEDNLARDPIATAADPLASPSVYLQSSEQHAGDDQTLSAALHSVIDHMKEDGNLRDLMIMEGLFYAGLKNRVLSGLIAVDEGQIAVIRHRLLKRLRSLVREGSPDSDAPLPSVDLLTRIWERDRPSCPKRTTLGKSLIGILDDDWQSYVRFHVDTLGCRYCRANRDDLQEDQADSGAERSQRIFQSTIGFISRP